MKVEFFRHNLEQEDLEKVQEVLRSVFLTTGEVTREFEEEFRRYTGHPHVVGVTSCTAALHLALLALGIGPGDEVITTPMTFLATATAILHAGARPVFVDVEAATGLIDPRLIEKAITRRTKAILPVHLYGTMADMRAIAQIAQKHRLKIVEDCAHCIEGERDGIRPGQLGDAACYSFYATKNLTSGEGGAVGTRDKDLTDKVRSLRTHGMTTDAASRYGQHYKHWDMTLLGWKYNMDNIHAALLVRQIKRLDAYWKRRDEIAGIYEARLRAAKGISLPAVYGKSARHLQTVWVAGESRDRVLEGMQKREVSVAVNYRAVHTLIYFSKTFGYKPADFPQAYEIGCRTLSIPLYPKMSNEEAEYVAASLQEAVSGA